MVMTKMNWSGPNCDFQRSKITIWSWPFHFGRDQIIMVKSKSIWSDQNQFGQNKTILDQPKLFCSHRRTRHWRKFLEESFCKNCTLIFLESLLKSDVTSHLILFFVKNFKEKEICSIFDRMIPSTNSFKWTLVVPQINRFLSGLKKPC